MIIQILVICLVSIGLLFFLGGTLGILRMPDAYTRMHAAGKLDTLGALNILLGLALWQCRHGFDVEHLLVSAKIMLIFGFVSFASPTATHAGIRVGIPPWFKGDYFVEGKRS